MTDWELITEQIHRAMKSVKTAHEASENLQSEVNAKNLDAFALELSRLNKQLSRMKWALEDPEYSMDEVINYLSMLLSGKTSYRKSGEVETLSAPEEERIAK